MTDQELAAMLARCERDCGQDENPLECCKEHWAVVAELQEARELLRRVAEDSRDLCYAEDDVYCTFGCDHDYVNMRHEPDCLHIRIRAFLGGDE